MHHLLRHLLQKRTDTIILHVDTNNCLEEPSCVVLDRILNLKTFIENSLPKCKVIICNIINRTDDSKVSLTKGNLNNHLNSLKLNIVDNSTIDKKCLGKRGTGKLAIIFIDKIRSLWLLNDSFYAPNLASSVIVNPNDASISGSQNSHFEEQSENFKCQSKFKWGAEEILRYLKLKNVNRWVIPHLDIKFLRNKFDSLKLHVKNSLDVLMTSETKLDETFLKVNFLWMGLPHHIGWIEIQLEVV